MFLAEKEAEEKTCPGDRFNNWEGTAYCKASKCMAWRWEPERDGEDAVSGKKDGTQKGYCGLAGIPIEYADHISAPDL